MGCRESGEDYYKIVNIHIYKNLDELKDLLNKYIYHKDHIIIIVGYMKIIYRGRASSEADYARRLLMIKPDGTLLIHEARGRDPINWQPPGSICSFGIENQELKLRCQRQQYNEEVIVYFKDLFHIGVAILDVSNFFEVKGVEKDIVDQIISTGLPIDRNAKLVGKEISTPHGKIDLVYINNERDIIYIIEVKNEKAGVAAVDQLRRYVEYMKQHSRGRNIIGVLIANGISDEAIKLILTYDFIFLNIRNLRIIKRERKLDTYLKDSSVNSLSS